jgi:outer membrane protein TolC
MIATLYTLLCLRMATAAIQPLSLSDYLEQVKTGSPEARATVQSVISYEALAREGDVDIAPEAYAHAEMSDDKKPTLVPLFMGGETRFTQWRLGVRDKTEYGLNADLYFVAQRTVVYGVSQNFLPVNNYQDSTAVLQLTQSFWRNGFGAKTKAEVQEKNANNLAESLDQKFKLKSLLLNAQNAYWSVVSSNQIVKLQQENVQRASKLRDFMTNRTRLKLFDDTDAMQAEASYQSRQLELQTSLDDRATQVRQFNTLRGTDRDEAQDLDGLPAQELSKYEAPTGHISREDFEKVRVSAQASLAKAKVSASQADPQLDVKATFATNGHDGMTSTAFDQAFSNRYPTWDVGVDFSIPLDFSLIKEVKRGYRAAQESSAAMTEKAAFDEHRAWDDLLKQRGEAQGRYERALGVEKIQTDLVKREHQRLLNGRATTFEALNFEQNLALAQIQRVRYQLVLLQLNASIKTFEVK